MIKTSDRNNAMTSARLESAKLGRFRAKLREHASKVKNENVIYSSIITGRYLFSHGLKRVFTRALFTQFLLSPRNGILNGIRLLKIGIFVKLGFLEVPVPAPRPGRL